MKDTENIHNLTSNENPSNVELSSTFIKTPKIPIKNGVEENNPNNGNGHRKIPYWVYLLLLTILIGGLVAMQMLKTNISKKDLKNKLTPLQYHVTQEGGTETAYDNEYWDLKEDGIYVDLISGEPLFSSLDKYKSNTGWPSFTAPLESKNITLKSDNRFFTKRMEVKGKKSGSHLGHVFDDGPAPTGKRYCMNSASLRFIPLANLEKEGYGKYKSLFEKKSVIELATFAGGCFWCMEHPFDEIAGVLSTTSGYTGGRIENPSYEQVSTGKTGHVESNQVKYNSTETNYSKLLDVYFKNIDPTDNGGQFNDRGNQYRPVIFYHNQKQKELAEKYIANLEKSKVFDKPIVVEILPASDFYPAEDYHQDYYKKKAIKYKFYRMRSGRDEFLQEKWGY